jgi:recombinational DNA repair ATPase RecF
MAIADLIFKLNHILKNELSLKPVLLLDDIFSELDPTNVELLLSKKIERNQQTIITTTILDTIPAEVRASSHIISL